MSDIQLALIGAHADACHSAASLWHVINALHVAAQNKDQGGDVFRKVKEEVTRIMNDYMVAIEKWLRVRVGKGSDRMQAFADFSNAVRGPETDEMGNMTRRQFKARLLGGAGDGQRDFSRSAWRGCWERGRVCLRGQGWRAV